MSPTSGAVAAAALLAGAVLLASCGALPPQTESTPTAESAEFSVDIIEQGYVNDLRVTDDGAGNVIALTIDLLAPSGYLDLEVIDADGNVERLTIQPGRDQVDPTFVPALEPPIELVERGAGERLLGRVRIEVVGDER